MTTYQSTEMQTKLQANVADAAEKSSIHGGNHLALHLAELLLRTSARLPRIHSIISTGRTRTGRFLSCQA
jgi:hypothetical protein